MCDCSRKEQSEIDMGSYIRVVIICVDCGKTISIHDIKKDALEELD